MKNTFLSILAAFALCVSGYAQCPPEISQGTSGTIKIGPFLDETDGKTAETALTLTRPDFLLSKNGGALTQKNETTAATHDAHGFYGMLYDTTDTNAQGSLLISVQESGALPVHCIIKITAAASFAVNVSGNVGDLDQAVLDLIAEHDATQVLIGTPAGASVSADILVLDNFVDDIGAAGAGLTAAGLTQANVRTAVGLASANLDTQLAAIDDAVDTEVAAILVDTGTTLDARIPAALVGGRMDSSVGAMAANVITTTAINGNAFNASKFDPDVATELQTGLWTIRKNVAGQALPIWIFLAATGAPTTGLSTAQITCSISLDYAAFSATNDTTEAEVGNGLYVITPTQAETNADTVNYVCNVSGGLHRQFQATVTPQH